MIDEITKKYLILEISRIKNYKSRLISKSIMPIVFTLMAYFLDMKLLYSIPRTTSESRIDLPTFFGCALLFTYVMLFITFHRRKTDIIKSAIYKKLLSSGDIN